ncbi:MAG: hypothetical protein JWQ83_986 [Lacunisphaera sp.]|nr:hypothetical protein [Lacunisphaera sp.]
MLRPPETDFWQVGIVPAPIAALVDPAGLAAQRDRIAWLPDPGPWCYLADPFALRRGDTLHVFVEAFDYRTKHAVIEHHEVGTDLVWRAKHTAIARTFHLSYPFLIEDRGEVFMIPESQRHGEIALYRARKFPGGWVRETPLLSGVPGAETSIIHHLGTWWMFFTIVGPKARDQRELHVAHAPQLTGPWKLHPQNPVVEDPAGARPGGTPFVGADGHVVLPVQDCSRTYGGAIRFLRFKTLAADRIETAHLAGTLTGGLVSDSHHDGLHTLSACGDFSLLDAKQIMRPWGRYAVDFKRRVQRLVAV